MSRILVADPISDTGIERLREGGEVDVKLGRKEDEILADIAEYDAVVVRSETKITGKIIEAGKKLQAIARAGVGVDNIDVAAATRHGVVVVNSPEGNTIAAAEQTIALLMALSRKIPDAVASLRAGEWKRSKFVGVEVYNKSLGVVGLGKIGREVAKRGIGLGMHVLAADAFVSPEMARREGVELVELDELLARADYLTVHTPMTAATRGMVNDEAFAKMKDGVRVINCARGGIIDEAALLRALQSGKVAGAALDVFEKEPPAPDNPLLTHPQVITTPHLGASTEEAQVNVAVDVADQIVAILGGKPPRTAVNMPAISADVFARIEPYLELGTKIGKLHAQLADGPIDEVEVSYSGDILNLDVQPVTRGVLIGLLQPMLEESVNFVNAPFIADERGIRLTESKTAGEGEYPNYMCVTVREGDKRHTIGGTVLGRRDQRIREIDQFRIDLKPEGYLLVVPHQDRPGIIGAVGTLLGQANINIGGMYVGREERGRRAVMILSIDEPTPSEMLEKIREAAGAEYCRLIAL